MLDCVALRMCILRYKQVFAKSAYACRGAGRWRRHRVNKASIPLAFLISKYLFLFNFLFWSTVAHHTCALGVTGTERSAIAPQVQTLAEADVVGGEVSNWIGVVAPRGTSPSQIDHLSRAATAVIRNVEIAAKLNSAGITLCGSTPVAFGEFIVAELRRWAPVIARFTPA